MEALKRIKSNTLEARLCKKNGDPNFDVNFYIVNAKGEYAGVGMYGESPEDKGWAGNKTNKIQYAVCDENGPRSIPVEGLLPGSASG